MDEIQERKEETTVLEVDRFNWSVPECCREGWDTCPHYIRSNKKPRKRNIGM